MKNIRAAVALFLLAVFLAGLAKANTSSVNPNVPAQNSPLSSSVLRGNFGATNADENTIYGILTLSSNQLLGTVNAGNAGALNVPTCSAGALSWTPGTGFGCNSLSGLVSPITQSLVFTGAHAIDLNSASLPTKQTGTVIQFGNADTIAARIEGDAFAAAAYFTGIRWDGTNGSPTTLQSGDEISGFNAWGYNGSTVVGPRASLREYVSQNWTGSANGTRVDISTTLNNTTTMSPVIGFENDGGITVPPTVSGGDQGAGKINAAGLYVNGTPVLTGVPAQNSNTILGALTTGIPAALAVPSCSAGTSALTWTSGTGFGCNSISGGSGSGTVNSGTTPDLSYYASSTSAVSDASGLQYNIITKGLNLNGVNAHSLPDNGVDTTGVSIGSGAYLLGTTTAQDSTAVGANALASQTTGTNNTAVGFNAGNAIVSATDVTAVGKDAGKIVTGSNNTIIGALAASTTLTSGTGNIVIGTDSTTDSATSSSTNTVIIGTGARGGTTDTAVGYQTLSKSSANSNDNVAIGYQAGKNETSTQNTYVGYSAGVNVGGTGGNVGIGYFAASAAGISNATAVGVSSCGDATGSGCTAVGNSAGQLIGSGANNTAIGINAIGNGAVGAVTGASNTAIGASAMKLLGAGAAQNTCVGTNCLQTETVGTQNTSLGFASLGLLTTGTLNIAIGYQAGDTNLTTGSSNILIGNSLDVPASSTSNAIIIGNTLFYNSAGGATAPAVTSCGTNSIDSHANNKSGTVNITAGTPSSCTITFASSGYSTWNHCRVTGETSLAAFAYSYTTTAITVAGTSLSGKIDYDCDGQ